MLSHLSSQSLIAKFVHLARFFNPRDQLDARSAYAQRTVSAEKIFSGVIGEFNPFHHHQDCHEFFSLILDRLHEEMATVYQAPAEEERAQVADEWQEVGAHNQ